MADAIGEAEGPAGTCRRASVATPSPRPRELEVKFLQDISVQTICRMWGEQNKSDPQTPHLDPQGEVHRGVPHRLSWAARFLSRSYLDPPGDSGSRSQVLPQAEMLQNGSAPRNQKQLIVDQMEAICGFGKPQCPGDA